MAVAWAEFTDAYESLAVMGYEATPVNVSGLEGWVHVFWRGDGRDCVGVASNPGTAMLSLAATDWPVSLPVGLCPVCHPEEEAANA